MENRKVIYTFGLLFSIAFALIYYGLFHIFTNNNNMIAIYYNQVGLYKNSENAEKSIATLKKLDIEGYIISKDELHRVICGISTNPDDTKENGGRLSKNSINYIEKEVKVKEADVSAALEAKDMEKILEMINNESEGNEQAGAATGKSNE